jgi:hypothetical protein
LLRIRVPDAFRNPQFWAEDGGIFFQQNYIEGPRALLMPYYDYLHFVPRLVAWLATPFGAVPAPMLYLAAATILSMWAAFTAATANIRHAWALGAAMLLVPHTGEAFATITGVQWLLAPVMALALATPTPEQRWARVNQFIYVCLAAPTGPFSVFAIPLALWRLYRDRSLYGRSLSLIVLASAAAQIVVASLSFKLGSAQGGNAFPLALLLTDRWLGELAHGFPQTKTNWQALAVALVVVAVFSSLVKDRRVIFALLFLFALIGLAATELRFLGSPFWEHFLHPGGYDRYFYIPRLVVIWSLILLILDMRLRSILGVAAALVIVANCRLWYKFPLPDLPWREGASRIDRGEAAKIAINPLGHKGPVWFVTVPAKAPQI